MRTREAGLIRPIAVLIVAVAAIDVGETLALRLPGVPYNVSELFLNNGSVSALTFFALGLLWIGAGARLVSSVVSGSRRPYLMLPLALVFVSIVSKMLVSRGVTYESLDDVLGTNNLFGLVARQNVWGPWWRDQFLRAGVDAVDFVERRVRYCALYSIPILCAAVAFMAAAARPASGTRSRRVGDVALLAAVALGWLWLSGSIVLPWAATDNLTELIAPAGPLGVPGPVFLLATMMLLGCNAAVALRGMRSAGGVVFALIFSTAAVPASWWLLNAGLEQHVEKYGVVFPATQFLLGPDRQHTLTTAILFTRWGAVYVATVACMTMGAWLFT